MEDTFIFLYTADYYDEVKNQTKTESGLIYGTGYRDVFSQIVDIYGDDLEKITIESIDSYTPLRFDPKHLPFIKALAEEINY